MFYPILMTAFAVTLGAAAAMAAGSPPARTSGGQLIAAPATPGDQPAWLAALRQWRETVSFDRSRYEDPRLAWARRDFVQALLIVQERTLYDPARRRYTVDRYLDDVRKRYGGLDSVIVWHTYPNIGIDDRNQHDHLRDMPGGLEGLKRMVADFHRRGVRVYFPIMPWDTGTRPADAPLPEAMARDMAAIGADGLFGDTLSGIDRAFATAADVANLPAVLEPELSLADDAMLAWNTVSWGQFWDEPFAPGISAYRWLEPRHMVHVTSRWAKARTGDLQRAFLNGTGYEAWENVWGMWNGLAGQDAADLRRVAAIQRRYAGELSGPGWEPYVSTLKEGVFASRFTGNGRSVWTIVNRGEQPVNGSVLTLQHIDGARYYDLWNGRAVHPVTEGEGDVLSLEIPAGGFGAVLCETAPPADLNRFLAEMRRIRGGDAAWAVLPQRIVDIPPTKRYAVPPPGMVRVPAATFDFNVSGVEIEGSDEFGVDVQYPWESAPVRVHSRRMEVPAFYIDRTPVTNAEFKRFLDSARYRPADPHNFLRHWKGGSYPTGWAGKPVTWVSLEDARAYARWAGKRLPHEWEWQYAAQGTDGRLYPWGSEMRPSAFTPPDSGREMLPPSDVDAHPAGAGPFGTMDMVGNVWQWTDEFVDAHTRAAVLRGGSHYHPGGSDWYFPQALRLDRHGKYLLMSPGKDRSAAIGFRCAADAVN